MGIDIFSFKENIEPKLLGYKLKYSTFFNGDFGDLERVEFDGKGKIGGLDFWSKGWLEIDVYDLVLDKVIINALLEPSEVELQKKAIEDFLEALLND